MEHPAPVQSRPRSRAALLTLIAVVTLLGLIRAGALLWHAPLLAYANSYDQVRYSACFDVYPDRARDIGIEQNNPQAPYARYAFYAAGAGNKLCYWSSESLPQALVIAGWKAAEALGAGPSHSVRTLGIVKFALLAALNIALTLAWWPRRPAAALANAALLPLVFADPANLLYASTFYAEFSALTALYATLALALLFVERPRSALRALLLAAAACALGMSKLQHLLLPLLLAATLFASGRLLAQRWGWQALALAAGGCLALVLQVAQLSRSSVIGESLRAANATDVVLTALLPSSPDPRRTLADLGLGAQCLAWSGRHAWELPDFDYERACPGITRFGRVEEAGALLREPQMALRVFAGGLAEVDSWLAKGLGTVAGARDAPLPASFASLGRSLAEHPALRALLLLMPIAACAVLLVRRREAFAPQLLFAALTAATIGATYLVTVFGDGFADVAKQCHLVFNSALAWWVACAIAICANLAASRTPGFERARAPSDRRLASEPP